MTGWMPRLRRVPTITIQRVTAGLVILIVGWWFLTGLFLFQLFSLYFAFIVVTILVVRSVPVHPGRFLSRRLVRRGLVAFIAVAALLVTVSPNSPNGVGIVPLLTMVLALGFVLLGRATQRVASAPDSAVDERQEALRNQAHRLAYGIFAILAGSTVLVAYTAGPDSRTWLGNSLQGGGPFTTFFLLLFFLPAMVLAWLEPDRVSGEDLPKLGTIPRARLAIGMVATALLLPILLSIALPFAPIRVTTTVRAETSQTEGTSCKYFDARARAGLGFGAVIPLSAVACWDGHKAFEDWGLNSSDCHLGSSEMASVETLSCSRTTDDAGTLRYVYKARVRSAVLPFLTKDVVMTLVLARDGTVLSFP
jgi:hypothetical protein